MDERPPMQLFNVSHRGYRRRQRLLLRPKRYECLNQLEPGDSLHHTWVLPARPPGTTVWLAYMDWCTSSFVQTGSAPFPYTYSACGAAPGWGSKGENQDVSFSNGTTATISMDEHLDGDPNMAPQGVNYVQADLAGTYRISGYWEFWQNSADPPRAGTVELFNNTAVQQLQAVGFTIPRSPQHAAGSISWSGQLTANARVSLRWIPSNPFGGTNISFYTGSVPYLVIQRL